jgi:hypothetical protein
VLNNPQISDFEPEKDEKNETGDFDRIKELLQTRRG